MKTYTEWLIQRASTFVIAMEPLPLDLVMEMAAAGLDAATIETKLRGELL